MCESSLHVVPSLLCKRLCTVKSFRDLVNANQIWIVNTIISINFITIGTSFSRAEVTFFGLFVDV